MSPEAGEEPAPHAPAGTTQLPPPDAADEPYSIFDKRQKAVIVLLVSVAATCVFLTPPGLILPRTW